MPARFRLYDNGGQSVDRYVMIDSKPHTYDHLFGKWYWVLAFSARPADPQGGFWQHTEYSASEYAAMTNTTGVRRLGKRIGLEDLPTTARSHIEKEIRDSGGDPKSAMRGRLAVSARTPSRRRP